MGEPMVCCSCSLMISNIIPLFAAMKRKLIMETYGVKNANTGIDIKKLELLSDYTIDCQNIFDILQLGPDKICCRIVLQTAIQVADVMP